MRTPKHTHTQNARERERKHKEKTQSGISSKKKTRGGKQRDSDKHGEREKRGESKKKKIKVDLFIRELQNFLKRALLDSSFFCLPPDVPMPHPISLSLSHHSPNFIADSDVCVSSQYFLFLPFSDLTQRRQRSASGPPLPNVFPYSLSRS